jgi:HORMA domain
MTCLLALTPTQVWQLHGTSRAGGARNVSTPTATFTDLALHCWLTALVLCSNCCWQAADRQAQELAKWIDRGVFPALEQRYLRKLEFLIVKPGESDAADADDDDDMLT